MDPWLTTSYGVVCIAGAHDEVVANKLPIGAPSAVECLLHLNTAGWAPPPEHDI